MACSAALNRLSSNGTRIAGVALGDASDGNRLSDIPDDQRTLRSFFETLNRPHNVQMFLNWQNFKYLTAIPTTLYHESCALDRRINLTTCLFFSRSAEFPPSLVVVKGWPTPSPFRAFAVKYSRNRGQVFQDSAPKFVRFHRFGPVGRWKNRYLRIAPCRRFNTLDQSK